MSAGDGTTRSTRKFDYAFKKAKTMKTNKVVIVAEADMDCVLHAGRPFFIQKRKKKSISVADLSKVGRPGETAVDLCGSDEDDEENDDDDNQDSCISVKDIKDLNTAKKLVQLA